jgi:hypothetical protein
MAISPAMQWALANGMSQADVYKSINDFLATNPNAAQTQAQMAQYGISGEDVAAATGGKSGGLLGGNILAGASWNSLNTTLGDELTAATGQASSNYAVGGATTADTLAQLNTYLAGGGQFDPNATVYLQTGGVDFLQGVDKGTIKDNISQIVKTLGDQGVNVVLTGSPYAKSIDDVINNNFDPKVDSLFTEIAKENKNVALVGTQGEILQNKALLVDALHTNAEGTSIYNQSVIDALSQFKNEVPSSAPQDIAQVQQTNTVATTPPVITQAAASPAIAQSLSTQAQDWPTINYATYGTDGDIETKTTTSDGTPFYLRDEEGGGMYQNPATVESYAPFTGADGKTYYNVYAPVFSSGKAWNETPITSVMTEAQFKAFQGGSTFGDALANIANSPIGMYATGLLAGPTGQALGFTGTAAPAVGMGLLKGGTAALSGASAEDVLKTALLSGSLVYGGGELNNYLKYQDVPVDFTNMTTDQINDALDVNFRNDLARAGLTDTQIKSYLANPASVYDATEALTTQTTPVAVSTPVTDGGSVNVTASTTPSLSSVLDTIAATTPTATTPAVNVTAQKTPQQVDQATLDLVNSQIASNVGTPTNLANVEVTGNKPATAQEIASVIAATIPNITATQAQVIAEQVITSGKQVTTQDLINAVTSTIPTTTATTQTTTPTETPTQTITGDRPLSTQDVVNAISATIPTTTTTTAVTQPVAEQTITGEKPATTQEIVSAITAAIPTITTTQAQAIAEQVITGDKPLTVKEVTDAIAASIPTVTSTVTQPVAEQVITGDKPLTTQDVVNAVTSMLPSVVTQTPTTPEQVITGDKPLTTQEVINAIAATLPTIPAVTTPAVTTPTVTTPVVTTPTVTTTTPTQTITGQKPITTQEIVNAIAATTPAVTTTTSLPSQTIVAEKPSSITDTVTAATIPLIQPTTPLTVPKVTAETPKTTVDPLRAAQLALTTVGLLTASNAMSNNSSNPQYPIVPVPESWKTPVTATIGNTPYPALTPIDFGNSNLLKGTQWEKFLNPNYGKVPAPVQYSQPSNLSYNDLMGILGSKQGMPPASALSINDIISGIQNQYGQTPTGSMG